MITVSIVLYKTSIFYIDRLLKCVSDSNIINFIYIIDNSPSPINFNFSNYSKVIYIKSKNIGYGSAHNIALKKIIDFSDFHFIINPDIYFDSKILEVLFNRINLDNNIGLLMPKVLYPNGDLQFLCKKLPTPLDLFLRRFSIFFPRKFIDKCYLNYELQYFNYRQELNVPYLSGCFMLLRVSSLKMIGIFDARFFMYAEDIDLSRRMHAFFKTLYYPHVFIYHEHAKSSYKNIYMLLLHIFSIVKYFNKWGWFFDSERRFFNKRLFQHILDLDNIKSLDHLNSLK